MGYIFYTKQLGVQDFTVPERYLDLKFVASGGGGVVCSALDAASGVRVAIKKLGRPVDNCVMAKYTYRELMLMKAVRHENVIKLLNVFTPQSSVKTFKDIYLVMELKDVCLDTVTFHRMVLETRASLVYQLLCGVQHLHSGGIVHRDLKPANVVVSDDWELAIIDLGLARTAPTGSLDDDFRMTPSTMTLCYKAPEVCLGMDYDAKVDVWSVGCIMAEMMGDSKLFPACDLAKHMAKMVEVLGTPDQSFLNRMKPESRKLMQSLPQHAGTPWASLFPDDALVPASSAAHTQPANARDLLSKMLVFDPEQRISVEDALEHPLFSVLWRQEEVHAPAPASYDDRFEKREPSLEEWKAAIFQELKSP